MTEQNYNEITEIQALRNENALLRSLLATKFRCAECSTNNNLQEQLNQLREDHENLKAKQQKEHDDNKKMIGKIRSVLLKKSETKSLNSKPNLEEIIEKHRNEPEPISGERRFAGTWKLISAEDTMRYMKLRRLPQNEFMANLEFTWNGTNLILPLEPEIIADPELTAFTSFKDGVLKTVLLFGDDDQEKVTIERSIQEEDQYMRVLSSFTQMYNLTKTSQEISCIRIYERIA
ncbi:unnamed protein product [Caenorhabditis nigoni]